jgi:hypothetical protein
MKKPEVSTSDPALKSAGAPRSGYHRPSKWCAGIEFMIEVTFTESVGHFLPPKKKGGFVGGCRRSIHNYKNYLAY